MLWRRMREWYDGPRLPLTITALVLAVVGVGEGTRLHASALWGSRTWLYAVTAGAAAAVPGVAMMVRAMVRYQRYGIEAIGLIGWGYTCAWVVSFASTHSKLDLTPPLDSPFQVGALAFLLVFAVGLLAVLTWIAFGRDEPRVHSDDDYRDG